MKSSERAFHSNHYLSENAAKSRCICDGHLMSWVGVTVKHVCNDHLYDKIYYLWFIQ